MFVCFSGKTFSLHLCICAIKGKCYDNLKAMNIQLCTVRKTASLLRWAIVGVVGMNMSL